MELVSIIIPYFKKKKYIKSTLSSVLKQSHKKIEVILIYDQESKTDFKYIKEITKKDKRIHIILNKKNLGAGKSRNIGINAARGKYICFIDADDIWKKNKIKKQLMFMKKNNYLISHTDYEIIDERNKIIGYRKAINFSKVETLLKSCDIGLSTVMAQKKVFSRNIFFADLKTKEDFILWIRILKKKINIYAFKSSQTRWRKLEGSLSSSSIQKLKDGFKVYNHYMNYSILNSLYLLLILSLNFLKKSFLQ